jgi:hypothetical protein
MDWKLEFVVVPVAMETPSITSRSSRMGCPTGQQSLNSNPSATTDAKPSTIRVMKAPAIVCDVAGDL